MPETEKKWWDQDKPLRSTGELVTGGGTAGAVMTLLYVIIGIGFWGLVGYGLDWLIGTTWLVWVGVLIGAFGGFYLVYYYMRKAK